MALDGVARQRFAAAFALHQTIALAAHLQDVDVVGETVEQGAGQPLAAEDLGLFVERQIAGYQHGAAFVALATATTVRNMLARQLQAGLFRPLPPTGFPQKTPRLRAWT
jgi:hypothetical protein